MVYSVAAAFITVKITSDVFLLICWKVYPEPGAFSAKPSPEASETNESDPEPENEDELSQYVVKLTDNQELLEITYRDRDRANSAGNSNRKRLSDFIKHGLESGKVFVAMAHETIV